MELETGVRTVRTVMVACGPMFLKPGKLGDDDDGTGLWTASVERLVLRGAGTGWKLVGWNVLRSLETGNQESGREMPRNRSRSNPSADAITGIGTFGGKR